MDFRNSKLEIYPYSDTHHTAVVKDPRLANKLNRSLKYYEDYKFQEFEEPVFRFENTKLDLVLVVLGLENLNNQK